VALRHGWHGTGAAAGAATGEDLLHEACGALLPGVVHVDPPYCYRCPWSLKYPSCGLRCAEAVGEKIEELGPARVTAVLAEPLMGARIVDPPDDYLRTLRELCDRHGIFLIVDEITTGFGRTGALTRCEQLGVLPDMLLLGKGITGGYVPLSALVLWERVEELLLDTRSPYGFPHGSTSDGHPLAAAAGMAVLEILDKEGVLTNVRIAGERLQVALRSLADAHPAIGDVRGRGLMLGVELVEPDGSPWPEARMNALRLLCMEEGLLVHTSHNVLDLMPPLILDERDCQEVAECLERALTGLQQLGWGS
jgi:adenosylmethionine-8-amino-7-oxononanoate aminotransferase